MRRLATIVLILAFWAFPAAAGQRHHVSRDGQVHRHAEDARLPALAQQLVRATHSVHQRAEKGAHHRSWREARALRSLHRLDDAASRFYARVGRGQGPSPSDVRRLVQAYRGAERRFHSLRARRRVEREFERAGRMVQQLERVYAKRSHPRADRYAHRATRRSPLFRVNLAWRH